MRARPASYSDMNLRHAAALALVGWYLMVPPASSAWGNWSHPVNTWDVHGRFESKDECEKARQQYVSDPSHFPYSRALGDPVGRKLLSEGKVPVPSECVSSDDPRLKGK
jgi:hypothetical protein